MQVFCLCWKLGEASTKNDRINLLIYGTNHKCRLVAVPMMLDILSRSGKLRPRSAARSSKNTIRHRQWNVHKPATVIMGAAMAETETTR